MTLSPEQFESLELWIHEVGKYEAMHLQGIARSEDWCALQKQRDEARRLLVGGGRGKDER